MTNSTDGLRSSSQDDRYCLSPKVSYTRVTDEYVAVEQSAGDVLVLNELGGRLLELADQGLSLRAMIPPLLEEYDVDQETLENDLKEFLPGLVEAGLVQPSEE